MKITILCSDADHPINEYLRDWQEKRQEKHEISIVRRKADLPGGELLFLLSCHEIVPRETRAAYRVCLVVHASDLPHGRGWSPHVWEIADGAGELTVSLLEAEDDVDSGAIWEKEVLPIAPHLLWDEIHRCLFAAEFRLIDFAIENFNKVRPEKQPDFENPKYYPRRYPEDSRLDPHLSIAAQFNKIRICDPQRYPAFFELHGHRYKLMIEKMDMSTNDNR